MSSRKSGIVRRLSIIFFLCAMLGPASLLPAGGRQIGRPIINPLVANATPLNLNVTLHGTGATFPVPLIANWTVMYHRQFGNTTVSYSGIGSGGGRNALWNKTADFAASDAPLTPSQRYLAPNVLHIPETIGSVVLAYNLTKIPSFNDVPKGLNFTGDLIAKIYLGQVHLWTDPAIAALNPHTTFPNHNITTVRRSDSSGTTNIFTSFLTLDSPTEWAPQIGVTSVTTSWPGSTDGSSYPYYLTGNGNGNVAGVITSNPYTFGYVELNYALAHNMTFARIQNPAGNYIEPTVRTTKFAVENLTSVLPTSGLADWSAVSMLNAPGAQTYSIASFTYFLVYQELNVYPGTNKNETGQANALISWLRWVVHNGQTFSQGNSYVPLPDAVVAIDDASINSIKYTIKSQPIHRTLSLTASSAGFNGVSPGPAISVFSGDLVTILLSTSESTNHQFYIDSTNNNQLDNNETSTASVQFTSSSGTINFTFTPIGFNKDSLPRFGSLTYRDKFNPSVSFGTFNLQNQQAAGPFPSRGSLASGLLPVFDQSRVSLVGSFIVDMRTSQVSGNVTVVAVDKTSGGVTFSKWYLIPNLLLGTSVILNAAVSPYDLGPITITSLSPSYTMRFRELDFSGDGVVNIIELATVGSHFGATIGSSNYLGACDLNADGVINILDLVTIALYFQNVQAFH